MGKVHVNVNGLSAVHKDSDGVATATLPDVCKTQIGNTVVPIPYSNVAYSKDLKKGSKNVKINGNSVAIQGSEFSKSIGDDAGRLGGVMSGTNKDKATWLSYSFTVEIEGKGVCRLTDKMMMNNGNTACLAGIVQESVAGAEATEKDLYWLCYMFFFKQPGVISKSNKLTIKQSHTADGDETFTENSSNYFKSYFPCQNADGVYKVTFKKFDLKEKPFAVEEQ